jgi:hypothetical protein
MKIKEGLKTYIGTRYLMNKRREKIANEIANDIKTSIFCHNYGQVDRLNQKAWSSFERNCNYSRKQRVVRADDPLIAYKLS